MSGVKSLLSGQPQGFVAAARGDYLVAQAPQASPEQPVVRLVVVDDEEARALPGFRRPRGAVA